MMRAMQNAEQWDQSQQQQIVPTLETAVAMVEGTNNDTINDVILAAENAGGNGNYGSDGR